jgi:transglutaminase-like putative cysteine protease
VYRYQKPVEHSTHMLRLTPFHDHMQRVLAHELEVSVDCRARVFEDVFGNAVRKLLVETPFEELRITARSKVAVLDTDPLSYNPLHARTTIPLVWMPWQRHMLTPYLLPPELPETQLLELSDYARGFVRRNDDDLLDTLLDINATIFADYEYVQGATTVYTTAWEVYERRRGVCQDFTNLFICLARLLGVPARYVCGYVHTGPKHSNQLQSEASHAWVQLYLPEVGWKGFDPTNGILTQTDHVRVAVGRNYVDATPTSGTIYVGGGGETLTATVRVEPVAGDEHGSMPSP